MEPPSPRKGEGRGEQKTQGRVCWPEMVRPTHIPLSAAWGQSTQRAPTSEGDGETRWPEPGSLPDQVEGLPTQQCPPGMKNKPLFVLSLEVTGLVVVAADLP